MRQSITLLDLEFTPEDFPSIPQAKAALVKLCNRLLGERLERAPRAYHRKYDNTWVQLRYPPNSGKYAKSTGAVSYYAGECRMVCLVSYAQTIRDNSGSKSE